MTKTEKFIDAFKELETALAAAKRERNVFEYEKHLEAQGAEDIQKLRLCRIVRNYIQHNQKQGEDFVIPSMAMTKYIRELAAGIRAEVVCVNDQMKRVRGISPDDNFLSAAKKLDRLPFVPVVDNSKCIGIINDESVRKALIKEKTEEKIRNAEELIVGVPKYVHRQQPMESVKTAAVVTDTGTPKGKYLGMVFRKQGK